MRQRMRQLIIVRVRCGGGTGCAACRVKAVIPAKLHKTYCRSWAHVSAVWAMAGLCRPFDVQ